MGEKPTQWEVHEAPFDDMAGGWHVLRGDPLEGVYADLFICRCDEEEDAHLIAAAPDLRAACEGSLAQLRNDYGSASAVSVAMDMEAAIAKARRKP